MLENLSTGFWNIINITTGTIDWIIFFLVINLVGNRKISNKKYIFRVMIILIFMGYINVAKVFPNIKIILCIVIGTLFYMNYMKVKYIKK